MRRSVEGEEGETQQNPVDFTGGWGWGGASAHAAFPALVFLFKDAINKILIVHVKQD